MPTGPIPGTLPRINSSVIARRAITEIGTTRRYRPLPPDVTWSDGAEQALEMPIIHHHDRTQNGTSGVSQHGCSPKRTFASLC